MDERAYDAVPASIVGVPFTGTLVERGSVWLLTHIEAEMSDIAVLYHVLFAFQAQ